MNAYELISPLTQQPCGVFACGECHRTANGRSVVESCCRPCKCGKPSESRFGGECSDCAKAASEQRAAEQLDRAELVEWDGSMIYLDDWFDSPEDLIGYYMDHSSEGSIEPVPEFAFLGKKSLSKLDIETALEFMVDGSHDEYDVDLTKTPEYEKLLAAVNEFNERHAIQTYEVDFKKKIRVRQAGEVKDEMGFGE